MILSSLCFTCHIIKCTGEYNRIFHMICTDTNICQSSQTSNENHSICIEICSSVLQNKL